MDDLDVEVVEQLLHPGVPRVFRDRSDPFDAFSDDEFRRRFRFTKRAFSTLLNMLGRDLEPSTNRSDPLNTAQQLAVILKLLSANNFGYDCGDIAGVSQSTVRRIVARMSDWFSQHHSRFVRWHDERSASTMMSRVLERYGLPEVVGAIDGTHISIRAPTVNEHVYVNRHNYHSLNVICVVDDQCRFLWFSAEWPGSAHDSYAFRNSDLYSEFQNGSIRGRLVGDSAYRAETFLLKPVTGRSITRPEERYNRAICAFRQCVERSFGQLKRQFSILATGLRYDPIRASRLVASAICLRNAAIALNEPELQETLNTNDVPHENTDPDSSLEDAGDTSQSATITNVIRSHFA